MMRKSRLVRVLLLLIAPIAGQAQPGILSEHSRGADYRIGAGDLLSVLVLEAPELSLKVRVSARGDISLPLAGELHVVGLTAREAEVELQKRLFDTYMVDPHVNIQVIEMESHSVSVMGAVNKPGTFQIRGTKTLLEFLSLAEGLADNAGDTITIVRRKESPVSNANNPSSTNTGSARSDVVSISSRTVSGGAVHDFIEITVQDLLGTNDPRHNVLIFPGDTIKVSKSGMVYIVGEVNQPGAFPLQEHDRLTLLRAIALGEGLTPTAATKNALIVRSQEEGERIEIPVNLDAILRGKASDLPLQAQDVVFVPNSTAKSVARGVVDALMRVVTFRTVVLDK